MPGSRHPKRWQDVEELLAAGIDVLTTLNVRGLPVLELSAWLRPEMPRMKVLLSAGFRFGQSLSDRRAAGSHTSRGRGDVDVASGGLPYSPRSAALMVPGFFLRPNTSAASCVGGGGQRAGPVRGVDQLVLAAVGAAW